MQSLNSSWNFINNHDPEKFDASITVTTERDFNSTPRHISFKCSRFVPWVDQKIYNIFIRAITGEANVDMEHNNAACSHQQVTGGCGNKRGNLSECRCKILDRVDNPQIRHSYENKVIHTILNILKPNINSFHFKLAIFCSGELLGEQILLFRLIHELNQKNASGTIELFLIDRCYSEAIKNSQYNGKFEDSVGQKKYIEQFLTEICLCLPRGITVQGNFFDNAETYINIAQNNQNLKHHLLIGADIENTNSIMGRIGKEAGLRLTQPIVLIKTTVPAVCQLDPSGNIRNCYNPGGTDKENSLKQIDNPTNKSVKKNNDDKPLIIGVSVVGICVLVILLLGLKLNKNAR